MSIQQRYLECLEEISTLCKQHHRDPKQVQLVAVSKYHPVSALQEAYGAGCRLFGESRIQEFEEKMSFLPDDTQWHLIGSLQRKKVPKIVGSFHLIHSVDSLELAQKISTCSQERACKTSLLLQVNTSGEESKRGCNSEAAQKLAEQVHALPHVSIQGLMTMAPLTDDKRTIHLCFSTLRMVKEQIEADLGVSLPHLSMGMSNDYSIAIAEGATLLRIGSRIFG